MRTLFAFVVSSVAIIGSSQLASAEATLFTESSVMQLHSNEKLGPNESKLLRTLKSRPQRVYFGAVFVNSRGDWGVAINGYHNLQNAVTAAEIYCKIEARFENIDPEGCVLYATIVPKGFVGSRSPENGVSQRAEKSFQEEYIAGQRSNSFGAFAISGMSEWGYSHSRGSEAEAISAAVQYCQQQVAGTLSGFNDEARSYARKLGFDRCFAVDVAEP
jgi:hypothetical protein